ncbi:MAG: hypothetical protein A2Y34_12870 [Spirochaetes bacterium GWC1_27_15]|nr:MAG: hypothetical protein A2Y34_12870 [Spirochaetes bacterium GWC1_27_15]
MSRVSVFVICEEFFLIISIASVILISLFFIEFDYKFIFQFSKGGYVKIYLKYNFISKSIITQNSIYHLGKKSQKMNSVSL